MSDQFKAGDRVRRATAYEFGGMEFNDEATVVSHEDGRLRLDVNPAVTFAGSSYKLVSAPTKSAEADPNGIAANAPGSKLDSGKARPALVLGEFPRALSAVVDIGTFGANKYTPRGWLSVANGQERYADAAFRHQLEVWQGKRLDDGVGGTGGLHKAQVIWNLLAELELELRDVSAT